MTLRQQTQGANEIDGVYLSEIPPGEIFLVRTRNTLYSIRYRGYGAAEVSRNPGGFSDPEAVNILGSTWGGSALLAGFLGIGLCLEFQKPGERGVTTTTPIREIIRLGGGTSAATADRPVAGRHPTPNQKSSCTPRDARKG